MTVSVALAHDYLTQRGGAERVVLSLAKVSPGAPLFTSLYDPMLTYPEFRELEVRSFGLNAIAPIRKRHRTAFALYAPLFERTKLDVDVALVSSSGWAHGITNTGKKVVYCHTPARWLYQPERYLREQGTAARTLAQVMRRRLIEWDRRAASTADVYMTQSSAVMQRIKQIYNRDAIVVPAPPAVTPGQAEPVEGVCDDYMMCVARLMPYKNVDAVVEAFRDGPTNLVIVGDGPQRDQLQASAPRNVQFFRNLSDPQLRWLYAGCRGLVTASFEDYGLAPLEANAFGKPVVALRWGGHLDTVVPGVTGVFFDEPTPSSIRRGVASILATSWSTEQILRHAQSYSEPEFVHRIRRIVDEVADV